MEIKKILKNLECIVDANGPTINEYVEFTKMLNLIGEKIKKGEVNQDAILKIKLNPLVMREIFKQLIEYIPIIQVIKLLYGIITFRVLLHAKR